MASDVIKYGLLIGGGYLLYRYFFSGTSTAATAPLTLADLAGVATGAPVSSAVAPPLATDPLMGTTSPTTDSIATQRTKLLQAAGLLPDPSLVAAMNAGAAGSGDNYAAAFATATHTSSEWNWYFNQIYYGNPSAKTWMLGPGDNGSPMTVDQYLALRQANGLSGLGALRVPLPVMFRPAVRYRPVPVATYPVGRRPVARSSVPAPFVRRNYLPPGSAPMGAAVVGR